MRNTNRMDVVFLYCVVNPPHLVVKMFTLYKMGMCTQGFGAKIHKVVMFYKTGKLRF